MVELIVTDLALGLSNRGDDCTLRCAVRLKNDGSDRVLDRLEVCLSNPNGNTEVVPWLQFLERVPEGLRPAGAPSAQDVPKGQQFKKFVEFRIPGYFKVEQLSAVRVTAIWEDGGSNSVELEIEPLPHTYRVGQLRARQGGTAVVELKSKKAKSKEDLQRQLLHSFTGVWGFKVFWLATFTLLPLLLSFKLEFLSLKLSVATLVYGVYHSLGIFTWLELRHMTAPATILSEQEKASIFEKLIGINRIVRPLSWVVWGLLFLTLLAKAEFTFGSHSYRVPLPTIVPAILGVPDKPLPTPTPTPTPSLGPSPTPASSASGQAPTPKRPTLRELSSRHLWISYAFRNGKDDTVLSRGESEEVRISRVWRSPEKNDGEYAKSHVVVNILPDGRFQAYGKQYKDPETKQAWQDTEPSPPVELGPTVLKERDFYVIVEAIEGDLLYDWYEKTGTPRPKDEPALTSPLGLNLKKLYRIKQRSSSAANPNVLFRYHGTTCGAIALGVAKGDALWRFIQVGEDTYRIQAMPSRTFINAGCPNDWNAVNEHPQSTTEWSLVRTTGSGFRLKAKAAAPTGHDTFIAKTGQNDQGDWGLNRLPVNKVDETEEFELVEEGAP